MYIFFKSVVTKVSLSHYWRVCIHCRPIKSIICYVTNFYIPLPIHSWIKKVVCCSHKYLLVVGIIFHSRPSIMTLQTSTDNSFIKKLNSSGRSLVVFYGSQTGTGEEFAGRLAKEGARYRLKGMVADPEECDMVRE